MKKLLVFLGVVAIAFSIGLTIYLRSFNDLTINFSEKSSGVIVDVYNTGPDTVDEAQQINDKNLVASDIKSNQKLRLKKDSYSIVSKKNDSFAAFNQKVSLYQGDVEVLVEPFFSESRLNDILNVNKGSIQSSAISSYPRIDGRYIFENEKIFHFGDWYGATLKYIGPDVNNADPLLIVLKREGSNWKVITRPPSLLVSQKDYPEIPLDIADQLNQRVY